MTEKEKAYEQFKECFSAHWGHHTVPDDYPFPADALELVDIEDRKKFESQAISCSKLGQERFFSVVTYMLDDPLDVFSDIEIYRLFDEPEKLIILWSLIYCRTYDFETLKKIILLASVEQNAWRGLMKLEDVYKKICDESELQKHKELILFCVRIICKYRNEDYFRVIRMIGKLNIELSSIPISDNEMLKEVINLCSPQFPADNPTKIKQYYDIILNKRKAMTAFFVAVLWRNSYVEVHDWKNISNLLSAGINNRSAYDVLSYMCNHDEVNCGELIKRVSFNTDSELEIPKKEKKHIFDIIQVIKSDISIVDSDVIVNATDERLSGSGGLDRTIQKKAGTVVQEEIREFIKKKGSLKESEVLVTSSGELKNNKMIFHVVGPKWSDGYHFEEKSLANAYENILLQVKKQAEITSIAFPCISTGKNGFPVKRAAEIAIHSIFRIISTDPKSSLDKIIFVCSDDRNYEAYKKVISKLIIEKAISTYSPESDPCRYDYHLIEVLASIKWGYIGKYDTYLPKDTMKTTKHFSNSIEETSYYAQYLDKWNYDNCLAYIVCLQRLGYWSGGIEMPLYAQIDNGVVRKVLQRMLDLES